MHSLVSDMDIYIESWSILNRKYAENRALLKSDQMYNHITPGHTMGFNAYSIYLR